MKTQLWGYFVLQVIVNTTHSIPDPLLAQYLPNILTNDQQE